MADLEEFGGHDGFTTRSPLCNARARVSCRLKTGEECFTASMTFGPAAIRQVVGNFPALVRLERFRMRPNRSLLVIAGLDPAIQGSRTPTLTLRTWIAGSSLSSARPSAGPGGPAMTM